MLRPTPAPVVTTIPLQPPGAIARPPAQALSATVTPIVPKKVTRPNPSDDSQPAKRLRTDGTELEEDFIASNKMDFTLPVVLPNLGDKYGGKLTGQTLQVKVKLTDKVSVIKAKIQAEVGLAPGKQVIKVGPTTLNNVNSLAFYNISEGKVANLSEKKRGGKR